MSRKYFYSLSQTYSEVTPESCKFGDFSDTGFVVEQTSDWTLDEILRAIKSQGIEYIQTNNGSLTVCGHYYTADYSDGTERQECLHIEGNKRNIERLGRILKDLYK